MLSGGPSLQQKGVREGSVPSRRHQGLAGFLKAQTRFRMRAALPEVLLHVWPALHAEVRTVTQQDV